MYTDSVQIYSTMVQGSVTQCAFVCQFFVSLCSTDQTAVLMKHLVTAFVCQFCQLVQY